VHRIEDGLAAPQIYYSSGMACPRGFSRSAWETSFDAGEIR
jgi:hypothetical protein